MIQVKVKVFRYNPEDDQQKPGFKEYKVEADPKENEPPGYFGPGPEF